MPLDENRRKEIDAYRRELDRLGRDGRTEFVDVARRAEDWPGAGFVASHASKWGRGKQPAAYAQWAYDIKNAAGVQVYAYIHPVYGNRGLAFVDPKADAIVMYDCDSGLNMDVISPPNGAARWAADKTAIGTHWRLRDTER